MPDLNRQILLRRRPQGLLSPDDVELDTSPIPALQDGEALARNLYLGMEAAMRNWLTGSEGGYMEPVGIGEVVKGSSVSEIVESRCDAYAPGDIVTSLGNWQDYVVCHDDILTTKVAPDVEPQKHLSLYSSAGVTAFLGMEIGAPAEGDTVLVSAAAGGTGSIAGQIARIMGAGRVVGIAGSDEKCAAAVEEFGFDSCINYKAGDLKAQLKEHCPSRINVYFDNVGGEILDVVLGGIAPRARVVLCGAIASYLEGKLPGPRNYTNLMSREATMTGFITFNHWDRFDEIFARLRGWADGGRIHVRETIFDGLDKCPDALNSIFTGANIGKAMVKP
jgi:NADPH-dependent curcumin reductase CurA